MITSLAVNSGMNFREWKRASWKWTRLPRCPLVELSRWLWQSLDGLPCNWPPRPGYQLESGRDRMSNVKSKITIVTNRHHVMCTYICIVSISIVPRSLPLSVSFLSQTLPTLVTARVTIFSKTRDRDETFVISRHAFESPGDVHGWRSCENGPRYGSCQHTASNEACKIMKTQT